MINIFSIVPNYFNQADQKPVFNFGLKGVKLALRGEMCPPPARIYVCTFFTYLIEIIHQEVQ
jgi:hypothetical protein